MEAEKLVQVQLSQADRAEAHGNLGVALVRQGLFPDALGAFRRCTTLYSHDSQNHQLAQRMVLWTQRQIELDGVLNDILTGKARPASHPQRVELAL